MKNTRIGTLNEKSLHAAIKDWLQQPGDLTEYPLDGYSIDIFRNGRLIEIQTRNFTAIRQKIHILLENHPVHVVYPISAEKWIIRTSQDGTELSRRRSPKKGRLEDLFYELIRLPHLVTHKNFSLEVLLIQSEEDRIDDGKGSWRRAGWSVGDRRLINVLSRHEFQTASDYLDLLPVDLPPNFTSTDLAKIAGIQKKIASKMIYCLTKMQLLTLLGRSGRSNLYTRTSSV